MKKLFTYIFTAAVAISLISCDKIFDNLEGDLTKMSGEDLTSTEAGLDRLLANLYASIPMNAFGEAEKNSANANDSAYGSSYSGGVTSFWDYTTMRDVNNFIIQIAGAKEKGVLSEEAYNQLLGEALFIRAYYYFGSARVYGGVPIVTEPLDDKFDGDKNEGLYIPRSTEKETWDFILSELDEAAKLLPSVRSTGKYRATKWAALGLKSRVALWAASVCKYWDKASLDASKYDAVKEKLAYMAKDDADGYYQQCIDASNEIIQHGPFSLYKPTPGSIDEAVKNYSDLFLDRHDEEFIFGRSYKNGVGTNSNNIDVKNSPNQIHGSTTGVWAYGSYGVTLDMVDVYDNYGIGRVGVDGTIKTRVDGKEDTYIATPSENLGKTAIKNAEFIHYATPDVPFKDKDARFQASVIYPNTIFRGTTIIIQGGLIKEDGTVVVYDESNTAVEKAGVKYYPCGAAAETQYSGFHEIATGNAASWYTTGFGLRKFLEYTKTVEYSQNPWYDLRYAEILLNYCEAQVEKNGTNGGDSKKYLNAIRKRAAFTDEVDATLANVLKERRVEMAFEDDYNRTLYRRRAFYNKERDAATYPTAGRKHALIPMIDLREATPSYIFVRVNTFDYDTNRRPDVVSYNPLSYYASIPNYTKNKITPNPQQQ